VNLPMGRFIRDLFEAGKIEASDEVKGESDGVILTMEEEEYSEYLFNRLRLHPIEFDETRTVEVEKSIRTFRGPDVWGEYREQEAMWLTIDIPVVPHDGIPTLLAHWASSFSTSPPEMSYLRQGFIRTITPAEDGAVDRQVGRVLSEVEWRNQDIEIGNEELRRHIRRVIRARKQKVTNQQEVLDRIVRRSSVPLKVRTDVDNFLPQPLSVKKSLAPVTKPVARRAERPVLDLSRFRAVLELIDSSCRQFERTPSTFAGLHEEQLRDVILTNLNGVFEGEAVGEAFSKGGKTDIYLRFSKGTVFVAECKYWRGPRSLLEVVDQLLNRLTWHESYGVVILFSRNKGFTKVLHAVSEVIPRIPTYAEGLAKTEGNHFTAWCHLPEDADKRISVHVLVFNLWPGVTPDFATGTTQ